MEHLEDINFFLHSPFLNHAAKGYSGNSQGEELADSQKKAKPTVCARQAYLAHIYDYEMAFKLCLNFIWIMIHPFNFLSPSRASTINKPASHGVLQATFGSTS